MPDEPCYFEHCCGWDRSKCFECRQTGLNYVAKHILVKGSRIPKGYAPSKVDPGPIILRQTKELRVFSGNLSDYVSIGDGAYFWSKNPGTGKTTVACNLLLKYLMRNAQRFLLDEIPTPVLYLNTVELLDSLRAMMNRPNEEFQNLWEGQFTDYAPRLLLLDDIGAEKPSPWVTERLYSLINFRVSNNLSTIYTSNKSPEELYTSLDQRCASRILGRSFIVEFKGSDQRIGGR